MTHPTNPFGLSAVQMMKMELNRINGEINAYINSDGEVNSFYQYRHTLLTDKKRAFEDSIKWFQEVGLSQ